MMESKRLRAMHAADLESERQWIEGELDHLGDLALEGEPVGTVTAQYQADLDAIMGEIKRRLRAKTLPRGGTRPTFDPAFVDQVKDATDIADLIQASGTLLKGTNARLRGLCPFHPDEKTPSLVVYRDQGRWHCFGCHQDGDAIAWLMQQEGLGFVSAVEFLAEHAGIALPTRPRALAAALLGTTPDDGHGDAETPQGASQVPIHATDTGLGRRFALLHRDRARYVKGWGWMVYTGKHWERDDLAALRCANAVVRSIYREAADELDADRRKGLVQHGRTSESLRARNNMLGSARAELEMKAKIEDFDADAWAFNCGDGSLNLKTGELRPYAAGDMLTKMAPVAYDGADLGHWKRHIEYFLPNENVRRYVQRQLGRSLVGAHLMNELPIWHGEGANGRSTIAQALQKLLGDYCDATPPRLLLASGHERHPTELAELYGSRLLFSIEIERGARLAESLAKHLTGGDKVKGRFMHKDFFSFYPTWTIVLVVNHKPEIPAGGHATWRRIKLVPWAVVMPEAEQRDQDEVVAELVEDGPAVLRWLLAGLADYRASPHWCPDEVQVATATYRAEQDPLREWVAECCYFGPDAWASARALRASYEAHGKEIGVNPRDLVRGKRWGEGLRARGCRPAGQRVAGKMARGWLGVGLQSTEDETDETATSVSLQASLSRGKDTEAPVAPVPPPAQSNLLDIGDGAGDDAEDIPF